MPVTLPSPQSERGQSGPATIFAATVLVLALSAVGPQPAMAAPPSLPAGPSPRATSTIVDPGDPRSEGEGAGLVGDPLLVALGVLGLGALASGATLLYARLTRDE